MIANNVFLYSLRYPITRLKSSNLWSRVICSFLNPSQYKRIQNQDNYNVFLYKKSTNPMCFLSQPNLAKSISMVGVKRFELLIFCSQNRRGNQAALHPDIVGAPDKIRTRDPQIRSLILYPAELPAHFICYYLY